MKKKKTMSLLISLHFFSSDFIKVNRLLSNIEFSGFCHADGGVPDEMKLVDGVAVELSLHPVHARLLHLQQSGEGREDFLVGFPQVGLAAWGNGSECL